MVSEKVLLLLCHCEPKGRGPDKSGLRYPAHLLCGAPRKDT